MASDVITKNINKIFVIISIVFVAIFATAYIIIQANYNKEMQNDQAIVEEQIESQQINEAKAVND
jgi:sensor domain CHASE-containing protein